MISIDFNLLFTVANLLILVIAMRLVLYKPVQKILDQRREEANAGLKEAEQKIREAEEARLAAEEAKSEALAAKTNALKDCRAEAEQERRVILEQAKKEAGKIREDAEKAAGVYREQAVKDAERDITELVMSATEKVMAEKQGAETDYALYDRFLAEAEAKS